MLIIRNGTVADTEPQKPAAQPCAQKNTDIRIEDGRITEVGPSLPAPEDADVVDATGMIVIPGFVDTHRHTFQATLRMTLPDVVLAEYFEHLMAEIPSFGPQEVYDAVLAGARECVDSGITTLVDWSSMVHRTPDHVRANVDALTTAGLRAVVGTNADHLAGDDIRGDLLTPAVGSLGPRYASEDVVRAEWAVARERDCLLMVHTHSHTRDMGGLDMLERYDLFRPKTLYAHANGLADQAYRLIADSGGAISVCPAIETAMDHGIPATDKAREFGITAGLGADVVTSGPGDMFSLMRIAYAFARSADKSFTVGDALRMATLDGAVAVGLGDVAGSLRPGKRADLVLLDGTRPGLAGYHDPIAAVVLAADTAAVETVLVGGRIVKQGTRSTAVRA